MTSFSFIDYESEDLPFRQTIAESEVGEIDEYTSFDVTVPLELHHVDIQDELWSPFPSDEN